MSVSVDPLRRTIADMIRSCLSMDASARPTARDLKKWLNTVGLPRRNIIELLLFRLGKHAESLEQMVELRTEALLEERKKVDDLLREILPQ